MPVTGLSALILIPTLTTFFFLTPSAFCTGSYTYVSAAHGISSNDAVFASGVDIGSQALTPNWTWDYSAISEASIGKLHGSSFIDIFCFSDPYCTNTVVSPSYADYHAVTQASYGDTVTLYSPGNNGKTGYVNISYHLDGSITLTQLGANATVYGQMTLCDGFCSATNVISSVYYTNSSTDTTVVLGSIPITYGTPFTFGTNLFTRAAANYPSGTYAAVYLSSDFSNTATFSGLEAYTSDGEVVSDFTAVSGSGFDYNVTPASAVPEPSGLGLVGIAVLCGLVRQAKAMRVARRQS